MWFGRSSFGERQEAAEYQCFLRLLSANMITALESYLSDRFKSSINADPALLRKLVEPTPEFQEPTILLSDIFQGIGRD
jgi:hypothetical protein